ncbi:TetR family transcriptional regulator [Klebsiella pneumoniae]|uniref:TetR family transcriptional regulator n=1 Tax=Klebsiella pneumoniae TaxID=573 RepID=A0A2X3G8M5_KLEPN|nr:TetR family transcriptional regulator [Klebsiella pneumoniae]
MARRPNDPQRRERILQATLDTIAAAWHPCGDAP